VNPRVIIRPAVTEDLEAILRLRTEAILNAAGDEYSHEQLKQWAEVPIGDRNLERVRDTCVLAGFSGRRLVATNGLDLDGAEMVGLFVHPAWRYQGLGRRMVTEIERLAVQYGIFELRAEAALPAIAFFRTCGYQAPPGAQPHQDPRTRLQCLCMSRAFPRRQTRYGAQTRAVLEKTDIPRDYGRSHRLRLQPECCELATVETDANGREHMLHPDAARAWHAMRSAAAEDGITLQVASAFRSVAYQQSIIERKLRAGQSIEEILRVSAAPGFSEHHSGRAIDIATPESPPLETSFELTPAFEWLSDSAQEFGFRLSYPRNNRHNIAFEPWHWAYQA
jgi:D-alanyl-D-alanine carboxypeptidase